MSAVWRVKVGCHTVPALSDRIIASGITASGITEVWPALDIFDAGAIPPS